MDLLDYLKWRNDVSLHTASLNDIDNVILSYISYIDFGELFGEQEKVYSIEDAFKLFCKRYSLDELRKNAKFSKKAPGSWLEKMDDETRESIIMTVFSMIEETEAETFKEFGGSIFKNTKIVLKEYTKLPKSKRIEIMNAFSNLIQAGGETIFDNRPRFPRKES